MANDRDATTALDARTGQRAPSARPEREQRRHHCQDSKPDQFCDTSQGKHTAASIEKNREASRTNLIRRLVELGLKLKKWGVRLEEMVAKPLVATGKLPAAQDRHNAFNETGRFR